MRGKGVGKNGVPDRFKKERERFQIWMPEGLMEWCRGKYSIELHSNNIKLHLHFFLLTPLTEPFFTFFKFF